jgi:hypothetical protein
MAVNASFNPQSATMLVATNSSASTSSNLQIGWPGTGTANMGRSRPPPQVLVTNLGGAIVWMSLSTASGRTAAIPTAGVTTLEVPIMPGSQIIMTAPFGQQSGGGDSSMYCNTISTGTSVNLALTFGEGL